MVAGPADGTVLDVPVGPDGWPRTPFLWTVPDDVTGPERHHGPWHRPPRVVPYHAVRMVDPTRSLARDRRDPPWWWVYVPAGYAAAPQRLDAHIRQPRFVDGPKEALPVLVDRARARRLSDPSRDVVPGR